ncbi:MAG: hypothetical protein R3F19_26690 [Verrucomicrobiales bacterium]
MKPETDPWSRLLTTWRNESRAEAGSGHINDEAPPFGFSTRILAQWQKATDRPEPEAVRWLDIWCKCAIRSAFVAALGALAFAAFDKISDTQPNQEGLIAIPDLDPPGSLN